MKTHALLFALVGGLAPALGGVARDRATALEQLPHPISAGERGCFAGGAVALESRGTVSDERGLAHISYRVTAGVDLGRCAVTIEVSEGGRVVRHVAQLEGPLSAGQSREGTAIVQLPRRAEGRRVTVRASHTLATGPGVEPYAAVQSEELLYGPQPSPGLPARVSRGGVEAIPVPAVRRGGLRR